MKKEFIIVTGERMIDVEHIANQVKKNCDISDAKYWGIYSICGLLLRLRDLYKWERKIKPWEEIDHSDLMDWVEEKEINWKKLSEKEFQSIEIEGNEYQPFDLKGINKTLKPEGFLYGAGYAASMKPSFFLAELEESRMENGYNIHVLDKESARDLFTTPALLQGNDIFGRKEPVRYLLWEKVKEVKTTKEKKALKFAFEDYGLNEEKIGAKPESIADKMDRICEEELKSYLSHEIGEASDKVFPDEEWRELIGLFPHTKIEGLVRGTKDLLADTNQKGTLRHIIDNRNKGSLGFYVSLLTGSRKKIFPEIATAYWEFREKDDWSVIEEAREVGYNKAKNYAEKLIEIYRVGKIKGKEWIEREINETILVSLNV